MITGAFFDLIEQNADYNVVEAALLDLVQPFGVITASCVEVRAAIDEEPFLGTVFGKRDTEYLTRYRRENFAPATGLCLPAVSRLMCAIIWAAAKSSCCSTAAA